MVMVMLWPLFGSPEASLGPLHLLCNNCGLMVLVYHQWHRPVQILSSRQTLVFTVMVVILEMKLWAAMITIIVMVSIGVLDNNGDNDGDDDSDNGGGDCV